MHVAVLRWPDDEPRVEDYRDQGAPFVLLVDADASPPPPASCLEDWIRLPSADADVQARIAAVAARAGAHAARPTIDGPLLRYRDQWTPLSPVECDLARPLVDRFGAVVGREALSRRAWPGGLPSRNALDVHILRLRRRVSALGLEVRTVRSRGYLLQVAPAASPGGPGHPACS